MKKVISLFLSLAMLLSIVSVVDFSAFADVQTGSCGDNLTYSLDTETGVLTISGTGEMTDYAIGNPFSKLNVKTVIIENGVTSISNYAFSGCTSLTNVAIPNSVTSIGDWVFSGCISLKSIEVSDNNKNYSSFDGVLFNKDKTALIKYPAGKPNDTYEIPNSVTSIGNSAFSCCESLTNVTIPNSVTNIGEDAFSGCESLTSVTIPNSVTSIGVSAFSECISLTSVTISNSVTSIGSYAFYYCRSLTSVTIPNSVTSIGNCAFLGCYFTFKNFINNSNVELNDSSKPTIVDTDAGGFCIKDNELVRMRPIYAIGEVTIPNSIASIGRAAFENCTSLTSVTIPDGVTSIDDYVFYSCEGLMSVTIPTSVKSIGDSAFEYCTNLANVYYAGSQSEWNKITISDENEDLTNATIHFSSIPIPKPTPTPTPIPEPTPTPNPAPTPAPQPSTQPTQETQQQAAQQTAQQQSVKNDTATELVNVAKPKSAKFKKVKSAKNAISVEWKKVSGVKGYQVQVATDKKFKKNKKTVNIKKQKTTKTTVKKLKAKKKYYVRIRTYKIVNGKKVYSAWSKVKGVKTK